MLGFSGLLGDKIFHGESSVGCPVGTIEGMSLVFVSCVSSIVADAVPAMVGLELKAPVAEMEGDVVGS